MVPALGRRTADFLPSAPYPASMGRSDGIFAGRLPELVAATAVVIPGLLLTVLAALLVAILAAALPGSAAGLAGTAFAFVVGVGLVGTLLLAAIAWLAVGRARREVRPRAEDVRVTWYRRARRLESLVPPARSLGLSNRLEPDEETIVAAVRRRYVSGEIDEHRFERELERLLGTGSDVRGPGTATSDVERPQAAGAVARTADAAVQTTDGDSEAGSRDPSLDQQFDG